MMALEIIAKLRELCLNYIADKRAGLILHDSDYVEMNDCGYWFRVHTDDLNRCNSIEHLECLIKECVDVFFMQPNK